MLKLKVLPDSSRFPPKSSHTVSAHETRHVGLEYCEEQMKRRRNQVRDALNRTKDVGKLEKIAEILGV
jgi:hypothetical protein